MNLSIQCRLPALFLLIASLAAAQNTFPASGNVGIGTPGPATGLFVKGAFTPAYMQLSIQSTAADDRSGISFLNAAGARIASFYAGNDANSYLSGTEITNGVFHLYSAGAERMTFFPSGNVGVGATTPFAKLTVAGASSVPNDTGIFQIVTGTGVNTDNKLTFGVADSGYSWIQAVKPGDNYKNLALNPTAGNVGIGTTSPSSLLDIYSATAGYAYTGYQAYAGATHWYVGSGNSGVTIQDFGIGNSNIGNSPRLMIQYSTGNVGIGTTSPFRHLEVWGGATNASMAITNTGGAAYLLMGNQDSVGVHKPSIVAAANGGLYFGSGNDWLNNTGGTAAYALFISGGGGISVGSYAVNSIDGGLGNLIVSGNVGIGTANPTQKLSVNGTVRAKEVIVDTGWSDYVFKPDYHLASLNEVEGAIQKDGHLPGIPSASEVAEHGISVGEMQAKLLAKIEELTLHVIAQEKRIAAQDRRIESLSENASADGQRQQKY